MSTLKISNVQTTNATTDLSLTVGNTVVGPGVGPAIILYSNNSGIAIINASASVILSINSSSNVVYNGSSVGGAASATVANVSGTGQLITSGNVTPSIITSNTTSWNPDSTAIATVIRVQANAGGTANNTNLYEAYISGLVAGTNGEIYTISNIGSQKIQLRNEDSVNETTAGNRFNLPNNIWLYGYQSIQMIYDGTLARWKPLTCVGASPALSFGYDYDNTITLRTEYKSRLTKGFFSGGLTSDSVATANRTTYSSETTAAVSGANLSLARWGTGGAGNADKGFFVGGFGPAPNPAVATADRTTYSSETTAAVSGANLPAAKGYISGTGNTDKGFFSGGQTPAAAITNTTDRTTYSSETTAAVSGANLPASRILTGAAGNADKGFFVGGQISPVFQTTIFRTVYSTELCVTLGIVLATARSQLTGAGNADKGFFSGGKAPTIVATADKISYSSETLVSVTGANLSQARGGVGGAGNDAKGFFAGGETPALVATADRTTYSSETTAAVAGANLSQSRYFLSGI